MKYLLCQAVCLVCFSAIACAQSLRPEDVIRMRKASAEQIGAMVKAKGFKQVPTPRDSPMTVLTYVYQGIENDMKVQRLLLVGWHHHPDYVECEYDVWQQKDVLDWTSQLLKAGFTKTVLGSPDTRGQAPIKMSVFRKNKNGIYCEEQMDSNSGRTRYKFTITRYYQGDTL
jgi:hypothetical protein